MSSTSAKSPFSTFWMATLFAVDGMDAGPYKLHLAIAEERLLLAITAAAASDEMVEHTVPLDAA